MTRRISLPLLALLVAGSAWAGTWRSITPDGGSIQALAAAPGAGQIVYAVSYRGTLLRSSDGARTWSPRKGALGRFVLGLSVDPADPDIVYAHTTNGTFKSADGGESWSLLLAASVFSLAPSDPKILYAARDREVLRSDDAGATWTVVHVGTGRIDHLAVGPGDSGLVYAVGDEGLFRSEDGGTTWAEAGALPPQDENVWITTLAVDPREPSTLYAGAYGGRVFQSEDRGVTWSLLWEGPETFVGSQVLTVDPVDGRIFAVFEWRVFRSSDGGANWSQVFLGNRVAGIALHSGTPRLYAGTRGGLYLSEDAGQSWTSANRGFQELAFVRVAADPHTPGLVFVAADPELESFGPGRLYLLKTLDGGASWTAPFGTPDASPSVHDLAADPSRPGTWYLASQGVWKTSDGGGTWEETSQGFRFPFEYVAGIELAPSDPDALYAIGWGSFPLCNSPDCPEVRVFRSLDAAARWQPSRVQGLEQRGLPSSLAVDSARASTVYVAGPRLYRSTDGGRTWKETGRGLGNGFVAQVVADLFQPGILYSIVEVKQGWRAFKSTDYGVTWAPASKGVPSRASMVGLVADSTSPGTLYAATTLGVYVTRNGGKLWTAMNEGLGNRPVFTVAVDPLQPDILYAGREDGLFRLEPSDPRPRRLQRRDATQNPRGGAVHPGTGTPDPRVEIQNRQTGRFPTVGTISIYFLPEGELPWVFEPSCSRAEEARP